MGTTTDRSRAARIGPTRVLARRPRFRALFLGIAASRLGDTFFGVALAWLTLTIGSPRDLGLLIFAGGIPRALSAPIAGHLLDRFGLRLVLGLDNLLRGLLLLIIPLLTTFGELRVGYLYPLVVVTGLIASATEVGQEIAVPTLVPDPELESANALLGATFDLAEWVGPAAAGLLVGLTGIQPAIYVDAATFLIMAACATALPIRTALHAPAEPVWTQFARGFRLLLQHRMVVLITLASVGFLAIDGALQVFWPAYTRSALGGGAGAYGLLISAAGVGSLVSTLTLTPILTKFPAWLSLPTTVVGSGVCVLVLPAIHTMTIAIALAIGVGVLAAPFYPISRAILQRIVPEQQRGRIFGARIALTTCGFPTGAALGGIALAATTPTTAALIIAAAHAPIALTLAAGSRPTPPPSRSHGKH